MLCGCLQAIAGFFHPFQHWLIASGAFKSKHQIQLHWLSKGWSWSLDLAVISNIFCHSGQLISVKKLRKTYCTLPAQHQMAHVYTLNSAGKHSGAFSSWRARYLPQVVVGNQNRVKRGLNIGLAFISGTETRLCVCYIVTVWLFSTGRTRQSKRPSDLWDVMKRTVHARCMQGGKTCSRRPEHKMIFL